MEKDDSDFYSWSCFDIDRCCSLVSIILTSSTHSEKSVGLKFESNKRKVSVSFVDDWIRETMKNLFRRYVSSLKLRDIFATFFGSEPSITLSHTRRQGSNPLKQQ